MSSNTIYTRLEYFYLIRHNPSGRFYAGSKYAKQGYCHPDAFWNKDHKHGYFTSSKPVKELIEHDGIDSFEVLEVIPRPLSDAREYETAFLKSFNAVIHNTWLNESNGCEKFYNTKPASEETKIKMRMSHANRQVSDETCLKISKSKKGVKFSDEHIQNMRISRIGTTRSSESIAKQVATITGVKRGPTSNETKMKISNANMGRGKGVPQSPELIAKRADALRGKPSVHKGVKHAILKCPHCDKTGGKGSMTRWHFNNCQTLGKKQLTFINAT